MPPGNKLLKLEIQNALPPFWQSLITTVANKKKKNTFFCLACIESLILILM